MSACIYVCEAHVGAVVLRTHDGFLNYCPLCKAEETVGILRTAIDEAIELLPDAPTMAIKKLQDAG